MKSAVLQYITEPEASDKATWDVETSLFRTDCTKSPMLLMRGLFACGVLRFVLCTKRWRVNFGLDPSRTLLPFSHPDVTILLSFMSYYCGGLTNTQLFDPFAHFMKLDQLTINYEEWVRTAALDLSSAFCHLSGINIQDQHHCRAEVFPYLRYSRKAIDYYLSHLAFPKAMRQFPEKLSESDVHAVVFFAGEELSVLDRIGRIESFQTSPFAKQLDSCLVYLDESHSRGADLKLPRNYRAADILQGANTTYEQASIFLENEGQGLEDNISHIIERCRNFDATSFSFASLGEEQERELAPEIEDQRQVERPPKMDAATSWSWYALGRLRSSSTAYGSVFEQVCLATVGFHYDVDNFPTDLLCTVDYIRTAKVPVGSHHDGQGLELYHRPVQCVMSVYKKNEFMVQHLIIISPFEANELLDLIEEFS
ncbi:hypothetical protein GQ44DRAFT_738235 [Phaeosphaeriaceae sp. PMI808]|nr:hypothetical protein GQ44DRAFT_738235 [Phaeosphaeriaceae sp. PMI808]